MQKRIYGVLATTLLIAGGLTFTAPAASAGPNPVVVRCLAHGTSNVWLPAKGNKIASCDRAWALMDKTTYQTFAHGPASEAVKARKAYRAGIYDSYMKFEQWCGSHPFACTVVGGAALKGVRAAWKFGKTVFR